MAARPALAHILHKLVSVILTGVGAPVTPLLQPNSFPFMLMFGRFGGSVEPTLSEQAHRKSPSTTLTCALFPARLALRRWINSSSYDSKPWNVPSIMTNTWLKDISRSGRQSPENEYQYRYEQRAGMGQLLGFGLRSLPIPGLPMADKPLPRSL
jgi:hypothetical protein